MIGFDAPAHGRSGGRATSLPEISAAICALSDVYGPLHALVAHSFGVACTLHALRQGLRVNRVVGISPPATIEHLFGVFSERLGLRPAAQARRAASVRGALRVGRMEGIRTYRTRAT